MASSSAIGLADLGLVWSSVTGDADLEIIDIDLASDRGLLTAALLSLFLDRRAENDDVPPSGDATDRRGWWADQFSTVAGDKYGSRLWLLDRSKLTGETLLRAREYVDEAFAWMLEDKVVASVEVTVDKLTAPPGLLISGSLNRPGKDPVSFRFAHTWEHLEDI